MSSAGAALCAAVSVSSARAEASRRNGALSRGPRTAEGKARSAQNALRHGLRAEKHVVLPDEDSDEFAALAAALEDELAPEGALQSVLAGRIARAAWRLARAERLEIELFEEHQIAAGGLGRALIRDGNGPRAFETLLRYRGAAVAELWRALGMLKALQAEQAAALPAGAAGPATVPMPQTQEGHADAAASLRALPLGAAGVAPRENPSEPEARGKPGESERVPAPAEPEQRPGSGARQPAPGASAPPRAAPGTRLRCRAQPSMSTP